MYKNDTKFVHLKVHTAYSLSEGAITIDKLVSFCSDNNYPAVGISDTMNLHGALEFSEKASKAGLQPIIGSSLLISFDSFGFEDSLLDKHSSAPVTLVAKDEEGYRNLLKLSTCSFFKNKNGELVTSHPYCDLSDLKEYNKGLILLTGSHNYFLGSLIKNYGNKISKKYLKALNQIFLNRLYVEIQRHGAQAEMEIENDLIQLAYDINLPLVATNEPFFLDKEMFLAHDALTCIESKTFVSQNKRKKYNKEYYLKSEEQMSELFNDLPEAIENSVEIAKRCSFRPATIDPILPKFETSDSKTELDELKEKSYDGLKARLEYYFYKGKTNEQKKEIFTLYSSRLDHELKIIEKMNFPGYFLIVADFIKWAKEKEIPVGPGRGSGAGSLVAWSLGITGLNPLRFGLIFERFLNPERISIPDFDIDFCPEGRDEVIQYVRDKYGENNVAAITTFGKLQARQVMRDVGRVLEMPYSQVDSLCKMIPFDPSRPLTLQEAIDREPRFKQEIKNNETVEHLANISLKLEGLYRHASTHAAGIVIGDRPLHNFVPLYFDQEKSMSVTQFDMDWVQKAGLVKFDFLGLKTLTIIKNTLKQIRLKDETLDLNKISLSDKETFGLLGTGETTGIFQLESSGMRDVLRQMNPDSIEDIIALVALYRPGPMDNIPTFIACKKGTEKATYIHPAVKSILEETYGVIVYQEQVMQIAQELSGYTAGEADLLRRAMGKKIKKEMVAQKERFISGAIKKGISANKADSIYEMIARFADYGFNKSHAACYALLAYQTAYLKTHYPLEFLAASMTLDMHNTDRLNIFQQELNRLEIKLNPPNINTSEVDFVSINNELFYSLAAIKNVGKEAIAKLVKERMQNGLFKNFDDLVNRVSGNILNKRSIESLSAAGAFDEINNNRAQIFNSAENIAKFVRSSQQIATQNQGNLFSDDPDCQVKFILPKINEWNAEQKLNYEFTAVGFYLSGHPLMSYDPLLKSRGIINYNELVLKLQKVPNLEANISGTILSKSEKRSRRGESFAFLKLSDLTNHFEIALFSKVYSQYSEMLEVGKSFVFNVKCSIQNAKPRMEVVNVLKLNDLINAIPTRIIISIKTKKVLPFLKNLIKDSGKSEVYLSFKDSKKDENVKVKLPGFYKISPDVLNEIKSIDGVSNIKETPVLSNNK